MSIEPDDRADVTIGSGRLSVASQGYLDEFASPVTIALTATAGLAVSYLVAIRRSLPGWELRLTDWINGVPDAVGSVLCPVIQLGPDITVREGDGTGLAGLGVAGSVPATRSRVDDGGH